MIFFYKVIILLKYFTFDILNYLSLPSLIYSDFIDFLFTINYVILNDLLI